MSTEFAVALETLQVRVEELAEALHAVQVQIATLRNLAAERRSVNRTPLPRLPLVLHPADDPTDSFTGWLVDYSDGGVGIVAERQIAVGVQLRARALETDTPRRIEMQVRHRQADGDNRWRLGCQFTQPLQGDEAHILGLE